MKVKNVLLILSSFLMIYFFNTTQILAAAYQVGYTIEKYGSTQTSIADAYFEKPATVTLGEEQYTVSMTVKTSHDLGSFPVQILNINGQTPQVSKSTAGNEDYYTFTFTTQSVKKDISGNMKVDIDSMNYHHTYGFNLSLSANNVPDLTSKTSSVATTAPQATAESSSNASTASKSSVASTSSSTANSISKSATSTVSSESDSSSENVKSNSKKNSIKQKHHKKDKESKKNKKSKAKKNSNTGKKIAAGVFFTAVVALGIGFGIWRRKHY